MTHTLGSMSISAISPQAHEHLQSPTSKDTSLIHMSSLVVIVLEKRLLRYPFADKLFGDAKVEVAA